MDKRYTFEAKTWNPKDFDWSEYKRNPVVLLMHDYSRMYVGKFIRRRGRKIVCEMTKEGKKFAIRGIRNGIFVGFIEENSKKIIFELSI